jgi:hypothetical protein
MVIAMVRMLAATGASVIIRRMRHCHLVGKVDANLAPPIMSPRGPKPAAPSGAINLVPSATSAAQGSLD